MTEIYIDKYLNRRKEHAKMNTTNIINVLKLVLFLLGLASFIVTGFLVNLTIGFLVTGALLVLLSALLQFELALADNQKEGKS